MAESLWRLRSRCHGILARIDGEAVAARGRAFAATDGMQFPEFSALLLLDAARLEAERSGRSWIVELDALLSRLGESGKIDSLRQEEAS